MHRRRRQGRAAARRRVSTIACRCDTCSAIVTALLLLLLLLLYGLYCVDIVNFLGYICYFSALRFTLAEDPLDFLPQRASVGQRALETVVSCLKRGERSEHGCSDFVVGSLVLLLLLRLVLLLLFHQPVYS